MKLNDQSLHPQVVKLKEIPNQNSDKFLIVFIGLKIRLGGRKKNRK